MTDLALMNGVVLPVVFGLVGFVEPCSIGTTLLMVKQLEGRPVGERLVQAVLFMATRALAIGLLGLVAAAVGAAFLGFQRGAWLLLGLLYLALGLMYVTGRAGMLMHAFGPSLHRLRSRGGAVTLGLLFGLNIPACAAPMILALLGLAAAGGASTRQLGAGFVSLALFGLALSAPLVLALLFAPVRAALDRLAASAGRLPRWTGALFIVLGLWSVWFGLFVSIAD